MIDKYIQERILEEANLIIREKCTIREIAERLFISKSTVHIDLVKRLPFLNTEISLKVKNILEKNKAESTIRGGMATSEKWKVIHQSNGLSVNNI